MISSQDRSGWFGASDVDFIVGNRKTATWQKWWLEKLGLRHNSFSNTAINAGKYKEHQILEYIGALEMDKQILLPDLLLRINLDGNTGKKIHEAKTFAWVEDWKPPKKYIRQVNVQMFGHESRDAEIVAYGLLPEDYENFFLPIDPKRLIRIPVEYDEAFIDKFKPNLCELADCLKRGVMPNEAFV